MLKHRERAASLRGAQVRVQERWMKIVCRGLFLLAIAAAGCGETPIATSPTQSPFSQDSSGLWLGALVLTDVTGGECVGADIAAGVGEGRRRDGLDEGTVAITQVGSDMNASVRSTTTGMSCSYEGTFGTSLFGLNSVSCDKKRINFRCTSGRVRVLDLVGSTMNAFARAGEIRGVVTSFYNVYEGGPEDEGTPVSGLAVQYKFDAVRP
jgi:hypothetical protein